MITFPLTDLSEKNHNLFFLEVLNLCEAEDQILNKLDCYKNVTNLVPLRTSALRALAACHYITDMANRSKILDILLGSLAKKNPEIQEVAFECLQKFIVGYPVDKDTVSDDCHYTIVISLCLYICIFRFTLPCGRFC